MELAILQIENHDDLVLRFAKLVGSALAAPRGAGSSLGSLGFDLVTQGWRLDQDQNRGSEFKTWLMSQRMQLVNADVTA